MTDIAAVPVEELTSATASPMKGWEAFAAAPITGERKVQVRELGGDTEWHKHETFNGVAQVHVQVHGDGVDGAFIRAAGPDRDGVIAAVAKAARSIADGTGKAWFE